jgi:hypothetical protein
MSRMRGLGCNLTDSGSWLCCLAVGVLVYNTMPVPSRSRRREFKLQTHKPHLYTSVHRTALLSFPPSCILAFAIVAICTFICCSMTHIDVRGYLIEGTSACRIGIGHKASLRYRHCCTGVDLNSKACMSPACGARHYRVNRKASLSPRWISDTFSGLSSAT